MKLKALTSGLLIVFLVGCSATNHDSTVQPTPQQQQGSEPSLTQPTATPIQPQALPTDNTAQFNLSVAKAAKLNPEQVKQLISLGKNNSRGIDFKVIVPTYIPTGFEVDKFEAGEKDIGSGFIAYRYTIIYRNSSNSCFIILGENEGGWGAEPTDYHNIEVSSPVLGKVIIEYTDFDKYYNGPYMGFDVFKEFKEHVDGGTTHYGLLSYNQENCSVISLQEAIKIVESLHYLNP